MSYSMRKERKGFKHGFIRKIFLSCFLVPSALAVSGILYAQNNPPTKVYGGDTLKVMPNGSEGAVNAIRVEDTSANKLPPNEFNGRISTFKIGLGYIHDFTTYSQSKEFKEQMDSAGLKLTPQGKLRDFRILGSGVLKTNRYLAWKFAYMWDGDKNVWMLRETGFTIGVPELKGNLFIGRTKEGFSMVKVMNGHSPWTAERQMALDVIPILADGIKYFAYLPKSRVFWNLGYYNDLLSKGQGFSTYKSQVDLRLGWLPIYDEKNNVLLHIATNLRYGKPLDAKITLKSRPESNPTPQILNTGVIQADYSTHVGGEAYYRNKKLMIGSEVIVHNFYSDKYDDHQFYGGDIIVSYFFTKAIRPYNTSGSVFGFMKVKKSVFKGGLGEIEGVVRYSTLNLNDKSVQGGQFWRITPMVNWYLTKNLRVEFVYGYGTLDRYGIKGNVQFFESRIQLTVM
ncbi:MAG: OprO/OprP family phosphate-selective porin [Flavisolibacter sp.]